MSTPPELHAAKATVSVIQSEQGYTVRGGPARAATAPTLYRNTPGIYGAPFDQTLSTAEFGMKTLASGAATYKPAAQYTAQGATPAANSLGAAVQLTAQMVVTEPSVKICHVVISGFDTHQAETTRQDALLAGVDTSVSAFMQDLTAHGQADRVVLMTWSEFGRRINENGSQGTDHGAAAPLFVIGKPVTGGLCGEQPSLTSTIDSGNLESD